MKATSRFSSLQLAGFITGLSLILIGIGCKPSGDAVTPQPATSTTTSNLTVNRWILENMRTYYYWNDKIPAAPDTTLAPDAFFDSILYDYDATLRPDGDRFSWIEESAADLTASLSGETKQPEWSSTCTFGHRVRRP
ncbi:hypothetical protein GCM10027578_14610 [Spirosoma luteolum]